MSELLHSSHDNSRVTFRSPCCSFLIGKSRFRKTLLLKRFIYLFRLNFPPLRSSFNPVRSQHICCSSYSEISDDCFLLVRIHHPPSFLYGSEISYWGIVEVPPVYLGVSPNRCSIAVKVSLHTLRGCLEDRCVGFLSWCSPVRIRIMICIHILSVDVGINVVSFPNVYGSCLNCA